jgi:lipoprotein-anchoring transpeptidase ErfK/SrfK
MVGCKAGDKTFSTCTITVTYDPKTSHGTLIVTGMNKGDKSPTQLLKADVIVGGMVDGKMNVTPTGTFTATYWTKDQVSTKHGNAANVPWSKTLLGGNAFGPFQLHMKEHPSIEIHGTMGPSWFTATWASSIFLSPVSHGCVRMCNADDISLHNMMPNPSGNKTIIQTGP